MKGNRFVRICVVVLVLAAVLPPVAGWWTYQEIQRRLKLKIHGDFLPGIFWPVFYLDHASFEWEGKVRLASGKIKVEYNPLSLVGGRVLRVKLSSSDAKAKLIGEWAKMQGVEELALDRFQADVGLAKKGIREIYLIEAVSPKFQFHIKNSDIIHRS